MTIFILCGYACAESFEGSLWEVKKSNHFAVYYKDSESNDYVNEVLKYAEKYYEDMTEQLGFRRFEFWTWEKQCKIYIYPTAKEYHDSTGQPEWSGAAAYIKERAIKTFVRREEFLETILPHEMAHLIFREFIGYKTDIPLWLDEGISSLQEEKNRKSHLLIAKVLVKSHVFIPLPKLTRIVKEGLVMPGVFYAEAASVIEFLLEKYGKEKFVDYCRVLRDNKNWEAALKTVYGFKDLSEMNDGWLKFLSEKRIDTNQ
ncbi:MAG: peptidase MA family metallohydrolase [Candidatus Omnitrophota bacterium]|nr:peptidase MA family metallohydrolase [Candidatus Omnitrophota bacterium]